MGLFQKFGKKAAEAIKTAAKESTREDVSKQIDIWSPIVTMVAIGLIVGSGLKAANRAPVPVVHSGTLLSPPAGAGTLINIYMNGKEGI